MSYPLRVYLGLNRPCGQEMLIGSHGSPSLWTVILALRSNMNPVCLVQMQNVWRFELGVSKSQIVAFFLHDFFFMWTSYNYVAEARVTCFSTFCHIHRIVLSLRSCPLVQSSTAGTIQLNSFHKILWMKSQLSIMGDHIWSIHMSARKPAYVHAHILTHFKNATLYVGNCNKEQKLSWQLLFFITVTNIQCCVFKVR